MASRSKKDLHHILVSAFEDAVEAYQEKYHDKSQPFLTCTYRSFEEQNKLFFGTPKVTNAKGGESPHNYIPSLAFDIAFIGLDKTLDWSNENFKNFANIIKEVDSLIEWGGDWVKFKDAPHFQLKNWKNYLETKNK